MTTIYVIRVIDLSCFPLAGFTKPPFVSHIFLKLLYEFVAANGTFVLLQAYKPQRIS